jgi:hypothetical protein
MIVCGLYKLTGCQNNSIMIVVNCSKKYNFTFSLFCVGHIRSYFASKICTSKYRCNMYMRELCQKICTPQMCYGKGDEMVPCSYMQPQNIVTVDTDPKVFFSENKWCTCKFRRGPTGFHPLICRTLRVTVRPRHRYPRHARSTTKP